MQSENRIFDDISRIANGAIGAVAGMGREMEAAIRQRVEGYIGGLDLVKRDEFDAVKAMAEKARAENEALKVRLAALEAKA
jgi:BMFP domain-containing protein YqiC